MPRRRIPSNHVCLVKNALGPLEQEVLSIVSKQGKSSVRQVLRKMDRDLAYTTVMTTLSRLHDKGFLKRQASDRSYLYSCRMSVRDLEAKCALDLLGTLASSTHLAREDVVSLLLQTLRELDPSLLAELHRQTSKDADLEGGLHSLPSK